MVVGVLALLLLLSASAGYLGFSCFCLGALIGSVVRDIRWTYARARSWPFFKKVADWEKVEKYAKGELS